MKFTWYAKFLDPSWVFPFLIVIKCHDIMGFITVRVLKIERKTTLVWGICFFTFITGKVSFFMQNSTLRGMRNFLQKNDQKMIKKRSKNDQKNIIKNHQKKMKNHKMKNFQWNLVVSPRRPRRGHRHRRRRQRRLLDDDTARRRGGTHLRISLLTV